MTILAVKLVCVLAYAGLEFWLGKTDRVRAASLIELIVDVGAAALKKRSETK